MQRLLSSSPLSAGCKVAAADALGAFQPCPDGAEEACVPTHSGLSAVFGDTCRKDVDFSFSIHSALQDGSTVLLHAVLKFYYHEDLIEDVFGSEKPGKSVEKKYAEPYRIFPYCIFNSLEESPISWTYTNTGGKVYERVELYTRVTMVRYRRFHPFELYLLPLKVGTDGTFKTGLVNLKPKVKPGTFVPDVDIGVFSKPTSELYVGRDLQSIFADTVYCNMMVRDLSDDALGNLKGVYTRVYTVFFFEVSPWENFVKYILLSMVLLQFTLFMATMEVGDMVSLALTLALTKVATLFTMPDCTECLTSERILLGHALYELVLSCLLGYAKVDPVGHVHDEYAGSTLMLAHVFILNALATATTAVVVARDYWQYQRLKSAVKGKLRPLHGNVASYEQVDTDI